MLARPQRLRLGRDIDRVYRQGRYGRGQNLSVRQLSTNSHNIRAVVIVGKKVSKRAVVRNRNRRRLIEILAGLWQQIRPGCDIVVTVHSDSGDMTADQLLKDLTKALELSGALVPPKG